MSLQLFRSGDEDHSERSCPASLPGQDPLRKQVNQKKKGGQIRQRCSLVIAIVIYRLQKAEDESDVQKSHLYHLLEMFVQADLEMSVNDEANDYQGINDIESTFKIAGAVQKRVDNQGQFEQ